jgi:hypothetical protein
MEGVEPNRERRPFMNETLDRIERRRQVEEALFREAQNASGLMEPGERVRVYYEIAVRERLAYLELVETLGKKMTGGGS